MPEAKTGLDIPLSSSFIFPITSSAKFRKIYAEAARKRHRRLQTESSHGMAVPVKHPA
jgi:hypothetical protein